MLQFYSNKFDYKKRQVYVLLDRERGLSLKMWNSPLLKLLKIRRSWILWSWPFQTLKFKVLPKVPLWNSQRVTWNNFEKFALQITASGIHCMTYNVTHAASECPAITSNQFSKKCSSSVNRAWRSRKIWILVLKRLKLVKRLLMELIKMSYVSSASFDKWEGWLLL